MIIDQLTSYTLHQAVILVVIFAFLIFDYWFQVFLSCFILMVFIILCFSL